jgi:hypothetical protein
MILINLLPPELRKRSTGINPVLVSVVAGSMAALLLLGFGYHVRFNRIPEANKQIARLKVEIKDAEKRVEGIKKKRSEIAQIKAQAQIVQSLIARKQYWARTIDEFLNMMTVEWNKTGYDVCAADISFAPSRGAAAAGGRRRPGTADVATYSFKTKFKLIGNRYEEVGDNINDFFKHVSQSTFWVRGNFQGRPDTDYRQFTKNWRDDINKVVIDLPLNFVRAKEIPANWGK